MAGPRAKLVMLMSFTRGFAAAGAQLSPSWVAVGFPPAQGWSVQSTGLARVAAQGVRGGAEAFGCGMTELFHTPPRANMDSGRKRLSGCC